MNIVFMSAESSFAAPYLSVLLLRDNVQHHLLQGPHATPGYVLLHAIVEPGLPMQEAPLASDLWEEISTACSELANLPIDQVAISIRTRGLMNGAKSIPPVHGTVVAREVDWAVPVVTDGKATLANYSAIYAKASGP